MYGASIELLSEMTLDCIEPDLVEVLRCNIMTRDARFGAHTPITVIDLVQALTRTTVDKTMGEHVDCMVNYCREVLTLYETKKGIPGSEILRRVAKLRVTQHEHSRMAPQQLEALTLLAAFSGIEQLYFLQSQSNQQSLTAFSDRDQRIRFADELLKLVKATPPSRGDTRTPTSGRPPLAQAAKPSSALISHIASAVARPDGKHTGARGDRSPCDHCHKTGHGIEKCWALHPELRPPDEPAAASASPPPIRTVAQPISVSSHARPPPPKRKVTYAAANYVAMGSASYSVTEPTSDMIPTSESCSPPFSASRSIEPTPTAMMIALGTRIDLLEKEYADIDFDAEDKDDSPTLAVKPQRPLADPLADLPDLINGDESSDDDDERPDAASDGDAAVASRTYISSSIAKKQEFNRQRRAGTGKLALDYYVGCSIQLAPARGSR
jgi:hypothetical protein